MVSVEIRGADQLYELNRRLKAADKKLAADLRRAVRAGAQPAVAATKAAVKAIPVTGVRGGGGAAREEHAVSRSKASTEEKRRAKARRGSGLRATIASAIKLEIKTGAKTAAVRIVVDEKKLPPDQRTLPRHLDDPKGWRHPVFGRSPWVTQKGRPWFETTIRTFAPEVRRSILAAMDDMAKDLDK
jgi:hypothetical protein